MTNGGRILIAGLGVVVAGALVFALGDRDNPATLSLLLRCDDGIAGTLTLVNSQTSVERTADVAQVCKAGSMEIADYMRGAEIVVTYRPGAKEPASLTLKPSTDIETSPDGFFSVIAIRMAAPHLMRGQI